MAHHSGWDIQVDVPCLCCAYFAEVTTKAGDGCGHVDGYFVVFTYATHVQRIKER